MHVSHGATWSICIKVKKISEVSINSKLMTEGYVNSSFDYFNNEFSNLLFVWNQALNSIERVILSRCTKNHLRTQLEKWLFSKRTGYICLQITKFCLDTWMQVWNELFKIPSNFAGGKGKKRGYFNFIYCKLFLTTYFSAFIEKGRSFIFLVSMNKSCFPLKS